MLCLRRGGLPQLGAQLGQALPLLADLTRRRAVRGREERLA
jgi:hypothetical protein